MAKYNLHAYGQYDGESKEYYENGKLKSTGFYRSGFHLGKWKNYNAYGKHFSTDE